MSPAERAQLFWAVLGFLACCVSSFYAGTVFARAVSAIGDPPLREPVRPAEASVEYWTAEDVDAFRARTPEDLSWLGADDSPPFKPDALRDFEARGFLRVERRLPFISPNLFDADESS